MKQFRCPNGLHVWNAPEAADDVRFIYSEIFERHCYEQHGVLIEPGDVVLDVGANVGMFALSVLERVPKVRLLCFEPVAVIRACLERNLSQASLASSSAFTILPYALGSLAGEAQITYYARHPGSSTLRPFEKRHEYEAVVRDTSFLQLWRLNKRSALLALFPWRGRIFERHVAPMLAAGVITTCDVRALSDVIREERLERIDLLKVDVEGSELDVLDGIEQEHWPMVRQLAVEVSPTNKPLLKPLMERLRLRGFVHLSADNLLGTPVVDDPLPCIVYATR